MQPAQLDVASTLHQGEATTFNVSSSHSDSELQKVATRTAVKVSLIPSSEDY